MRYPLVCLFLLAASSPGVACSIGYSGLPYDARNYVFYGKVLEHISHRMDTCGNDPRRTGDQCEPAWGWKIEVVVPVNMPLKLEHVEYFEYTVDAACGAMPLDENHVRKVPPGSLVTLVANPYSSGDVRSAIGRVTSALPGHGLLAVLPPASNLTALSRSESPLAELACLPMKRWPDRRLAFEYWRQRQALDDERNMRASLDRLLALMSLFDAGLFTRGEEPTYLEEIVTRKLPPALVDEFYDRLPAARASALAACEKS